MHELISNPGVRFYLFELDGSLQYSLTRHGKAEITYLICSSDIEEEIHSDEDFAAGLNKFKSGVDASGVGIQLRLMKNDGTLKVKFEGKDGSSAEWCFDGLATSDGARVIATTGTQTDIDPKKCLVCGKDKKEVKETSHQETQTNIVSTQSTSVQAVAENDKTSTGIQTAPPREVPMHRQIEQAAQILGPFIDTLAIQELTRETLLGLRTMFKKSRKILDRDPKAGESLELLKTRLKEAKAQAKSKVTVTSNPVQSTNSTGSASTPALGEAKATTLPNLKRRASSPPPTPSPLHKRAKSEHNSPAWPRHLYMTCFRSQPTFIGDVGMLHIDVLKATVWFEGWYGRPHNRKFERKQLDLRDPLTKVMYSPITRPAIDNAEYDLQLAKPNPKGGITSMVAIDCAAPGWQIWGSDEPCVDEEPDVKKRLYRSANVIIDAIIHCIDVTSRRQAVHDPDAMHALLEHDAKYQKSKDARTLSDLDILNWEFTLDELKIREERRSAVVIYEVADETEKKGGGFFHDLALKVEKSVAKTLAQSVENGIDHTGGEDEHRVL